MKLIIKEKDAGGPLQQRVRAQLGAPWRVEIVDADNTSAFTRALQDADALLTMEWQTRLPASQLKLIHLPGAGTDAIDFDAVPPSASVCNAYGHEVSIAEYVVAAMLETAIGLRTMDAALRRNDWHGSWRCGPLHGHLFGKTVGIVGYGRIGREVARRANAFGMQVIACNRSAKPADEFTQRIEPLSALDQLMRESDYVVICVPLDDASRGMIDARGIALMKSTAVIINPARGTVIDEQALFDALQARRIGGAAIDTWYNYPAPGERTAVPSRLPFHALDNVIMTPHASAWTSHLIEQRGNAIVENLRRLATGTALLNVVRPARNA